MCAVVQRRCRALGGDAQAGIAMATRGGEWRFFLAGAAGGARWLWGSVMNEPCYGEAVGHETLSCSRRAGGSPFAPD